MFISKKKHIQEVEDLQKEINRLSSVLEKNNDIQRRKIRELEKEKEIEYKYKFPQDPHTIIVSPYVMQKFLKDRMEFVPKYPFPDYHYKGLNIRVDEKLTEYEVLFKAKWEEPPVICKHCKMPSKFERSYPEDDPKFCGKRCFDEFVAKQS